VALFAAAEAGIPHVPLNYRLADHDLRALATRETPALALVGDDARDRLSGLEGVTLLDRHELLATPADTGAPTDTGAEGAWPDDPDAVAVVLFTSGTTGPPKSAVLRHRHLVSYVLGTVEFMSAEPDEATLVSVPPYHIAGVAATLSALYAGRRLVHLPRFDPDAWIDLVADEGITHAMVVPTMLARIVERLERRRVELPSLRALSYGGGPMPRPVIERALELLPATGFVNAYGLTETSSTITLLGPDDHREAAASTDPAVRRRLGSVGRPLPGIEIQIRDETGRVLGPDTEGEVWVRGAQVAGEYLEGGSRLDPEGWFPTRDRGLLDPDGHLHLGGRADDVIVRGGENLSPAEIEEVARQVPGVADAAAVGVSDLEWGEMVALVVVPDDPSAPPDPEAIVEHIRSRLRSIKVPGRIVWRDELPYNETGKLLRRVLRDELADAGT
ncbi:MAG: long-chain fatty acid--CoA ligase, partial [Actinomyces sp.]